MGSRPKRLKKMKWWYTLCLRSCQLGWSMGGVRFNKSGNVSWDDVAVILAKRDGGLCRSSTDGKSKVKSLSRHTDWETDLKRWIRIKKKQWIWCVYQRQQDAQLYPVSDEEDPRKFTCQLRGVTVIQDLFSHGNMVCAARLSQGLNPYLFLLWFHPGLCQRSPTSVPYHLLLHQRLTEFSTRGMQRPGEMWKYLGTLRLTAKENSGNWFASVV